MKLPLPSTCCRGYYHRVFYGIYRVCVLCIPPPGCARTRVDAVVRRGSMTFPERYDAGQSAPPHCPFPPHHRPCDRHAYENHFSAIRFSSTTVYRDPLYRRLKLIFIFFFETASHVMVCAVRVFLIDGCKCMFFERSIVLSFWCHHSFVQSTKTVSNRKLAYGARGRKSTKSLGNSHTISSPHSKNILIEKNKIVFHNSRRTNQLGFLYFECQLLSLFLEPEFQPCNKNCLYRIDKD